MIKNGVALLITYNLPNIREITFDIKIMDYFIYGNDYVQWFGVNTHNAIHQQMIELGWIGGNNEIFQ